MVTVEQKNKKYRDYGEGSIYRRKDWRWLAKYKDENMTKPHYEYGKTETEVKRKLKIFKKAVAYSVIENKKIILSNYIENCLFTFKITAIENSNFDRMEEIFNIHIKNAFGHHQLGNIKSVEIQNFLNKKSKTLSYSSVKKIKQIFDECFAHAYTKSNIARNPMINVIIPKKVSLRMKKK
jgi:hypothetical protein